MQGSEIDTHIHTQKKNIVKKLSNQKNEPLMRTKNKQKLVALLIEKFVATKVME